MPKRRGVKITIAQAKAQGHSELICYCASTPIGGAGCWHSARIAFADLPHRISDAARLDEIPLRCSQCGSRKVDARSGVAIDRTTRHRPEPKF